MKAWTDWENTRRQVAIGGRVLGAGDRPFPGAAVMITVMPEEFQRRLAGGQSGRRLADADGIYYFLDLPAGRYTVKGLDARSGAEFEKAVSVSWSKDGKVNMAVADFHFSAVGTK